MGVITVHLLVVHCVHHADIHLGSLGYPRSTKLIPPLPPLSSSFRRCWTHDLLGQCVKCHQVRLITYPFLFACIPHLLRSKSLPCPTSVLRGRRTYYIKHTHTHTTSPSAQALSHQQRDWCEYLFNLQVLLVLSVNQSNLDALGCCLSPDDNACGILWLG